MKSFKKGLVLISLIILVLYMAFRVSFAWHMDPSSCKKCHKIEPYHTSWKASPHQNIDCKDCHMTRGPFGRLDLTLRGLKDLAIYIKGDYFGAIRSVYYDTNCINCHTGNFKAEENAPIMPKDHAKLIKEGVGCNNCHRDTGHELGLGVDEKFEELEEFEQ